MFILIIFINIFLSTHPNFPKRSIMFYQISQQVLQKPFNNTINEKLQYGSLVYSENDEVFNLKWVKKIWNGMLDRALIL